jgi:hypothetical protein
LTIVSEPVMRITGLEDTAEHAMDHATTLAATAMVTRDVLIGAAPWTSS